MLMGHREAVIEIFGQTTEIIGGRKIGGRAPLRLGRESQMLTYNITIGEPLEMRCGELLAEIAA
jgi:hypothetical protein